MTGSFLLKKRWIAFIFVFFLSHYLNAQRITISGTVKEEETGEVLIGANVYDKLSEKGTVANQFGFYSYSTSSDSVELYITYVGYQAQVLKFALRKDTTLNISLVPDGLLQEFVVSDEDMDNIQEITQMSAINVPIQQIKELPAFLGEVDVLKVLQLLPGVQSGTEGSSGLYVRGGGPDQNLILLDGVPVYNASHLFGLFSIFNADAINNVELIKGGFPARYGGRLSSVIDVSMKEGNMQKVHGEGSIGLISAKMTVEGPIKKGKTSFIYSGRRTYMDLLAKPLIKALGDGKENAGYYFHDHNGKVNHIINDKNRLYLSIYQGEDKAYSRYKNFYVNDGKRTDYKDDYGLKWGNFITALRWNNVINSRLFSNYTFTYSNYHFDLYGKYEEKITGPGINESSSYSERYRSGIRDWAAKADYEWIPNPDHYVRFGASVIFHKFSPGVYASRETGEVDVQLGSENLNSVEHVFYAEDDIGLTDRFKTNIGLHYSGFRAQGEYYKSLQPRIAARYLLDERTSLKASFVTMTQFIHLLTNAGLGLPTDLWVPATRDVGPQQAMQAVLGAARSFKDFEFSAEVYYKTMQGLIEYKDGASYFNLDEDWQNKVVAGEGTGYGIELLAQRKIGKTSGWIGYTWSRTQRRFDELNFGKWYPYKYDRRHDVSLAITHKWKDNKDISLSWVYGTGNAVSLPSQRYSAAKPSLGTSYYQNEVEYYENRNNFRNKDYHRLDLSFTWWKKKKWGERKWTLAIYNVYNRKNPFFMDQATDEHGDRKFVQYSLFPIIPSFSYGIKF